MEFKNICCITSSKNVRLYLSDVLLRIDRVQYNTPCIGAWIPISDKFFEAVAQCDLSKSIKYLSTLKD